MADGHHLHGELLKQEKWTIAAAVGLFFGYFALSFFVEGTAQGLFNNVWGSSDFLVNAWSVVAFVWTEHIIPIFVVLDILVIFVGLYALIRVWPIKQSMNVFGLKPHAHGHDGHGDAHGHGHTVAHGAKPLPPAATWNEALQNHAAAQPAAGNPATIKHWASIVHRANTGTIENLRWSVMESDALVDFVLKQRGVAGENMAERLQNARWAGSKLVDRVFDAHRLRNELAHTPGFQLTTHQAERALFSFRDFLKELKEF